MTIYSPERGVPEAPGVLSGRSGLKGAGDSRPDVIGQCLLRPTGERLEGALACDQLMLIG
jgi:hypothetical protein